MTEKAVITQIGKDKDGNPTFSVLYSDGFREDDGKNPLDNTSETYLFNCENLLCRRTGIRPALAADSVSIHYCHPMVRGGKEATATFFYIWSLPTGRVVPSLTNAFRNYDINES